IFEELFLVSQRDEGMHVLGQFEVVDEPSRFVWIRGFEDMEARLRGLRAFYEGPYWKAHRDEVNDLMLEWHDVHLRRPLAPIVALTGGLPLEARADEPAGAVPAATGVVAVDLCRGDPAELPRAVERFERQVRPALVAAGHRVLGHFVSELA